MGEHVGTWLSNLHLGFHPPFMRSSPTVHEEPSQGNLVSGLTSHNTNTCLKNAATLPANDTRCWFYSLPHFQPPITNSVGISNGEITAQNIASGFIPKRFLVVDQYKDQMTLMFGSGFGTTVNCLNSLIPEFPNSCLNFEEPGREKDSNLKSDAVLSIDLSKEDDLSTESEMHEDTEELNALLYSDEDESDNEEDEVTSTGHSPNNEAEERRLSLEEEVASSVGAGRKRKRSGEEENVVKPFKVYTFGSSKERESFKQEIISESKLGKEELSSFSSNKRSRKEKIRETVSVLQSIIPGSHGKEAMEVLDEAIHYLRSLKLKAKTLGLIPFSQG